jgi:addiction module HigA family antidote
MDDLRRTRRPTLPGTILREHYLAARGISITDLAAATGLSRKHLSQIVNGHKRLEPAVALRLARFWLNLQTTVDTWDAENDAEAWQPGRVFSAGEAHP